MGKRHEVPTKEQAEILKRNGLLPLSWVIVEEFEHSMIIKHRVTGEFKVIEK